MLSTKLVYFVLTALLPIVSYAELPIACGGLNCGGNASQFVTSGSASYSTSANGVVGTIRQESERAILNWQSFNVGQNNTVRFIQPGVSSTALNRIFQGSPSQILGTISANGQVYLINNNGIVFGENSQVNVGGLVASTLDISDEQFETIRTLGLTELEGGTVADASIEINSGALIQTIGDGRVLIFAPEVINEGMIKTPGGQTILGGVTDKAYLTLAGQGSGIRGLLVELETGGDVSNLGSVIAERGNVTLIGQAVRQAGSITATTSVNENGSIRLLAQDGAASASANINQPNSTRAGEVIIDSGSRTQVLPDYKSSLTVSDADQDQVKSTIEILGKTVEFENNSITRATGGNIDVTATTVPRNTNISSSQNDSRIIVRPGALIDASGDDTTVLSAARNQLETNIRANELADVPAQKDGPLLNQVVKIDARFGTDLADVSATLSSIERSAAERLSPGGEVNFRSDGDVILSRGSTIDVSGGKVRYNAAVIETSELIVGSDIVSITVANTATQFNSLGSAFNRNFIPSYTEGKDAGSINVTAYDAIIEGRLRGSVTRGIFQREMPRSLNDVPAFARPFEQAPQLAQFVLDVSVNDVNFPDIQVGSGLLSNAESPSLPITESLGADHIIKIDSSIINNFGIGEFKLNTSGNFTLNRNSNLSLPIGGGLDVEAGEIDINSSVQAHSGSISFSTTNNIADTSTDGSINISSSTVLDASGLWINDYADLVRFQPVSNLLKGIDGGEILLSANGDLILNNGTRLDVSGSGFVNSSRQLTAGIGGSIDLSTNVLGMSSDLTLNGSLLGYAIEQGGALSIEGNGFVINSSGSNTHPNLQPLAASFFSRGGFSEFNITSNRNGLLIHSSADINPRMQNLIVDNRAILLPTSANITGRNIEQFSRLATRPVFERLPVSLSFNSNQSALGSGEPDPLQNNLDFQRGASINLDVGGNVSLTSDNSLFFDGKITAPAGNINLQIIAPQYGGLDLGFLSNQAIWLGSSAVLSARGAVIETPNFERPFLSRKQLFDAGSINLNTGGSGRGYIVGLDGSLLDVRGVSASYTIEQGVRFVTVNDYTDSGAINLRAREGILVNSRLLGQAAKSRASYGSISYQLDPSLTFTSGALNQDVVPGGVSAPEDTPRIIKLGNSDAELSFGFGESVPNDQYNGRAIVNVRRLSGQFDNVSFITNGISDPLVRDTDRISLVDNISLRARKSINLTSPLIDARDFDNLATDYSGNFTSGYIALGPTGLLQQDITPDTLSGEGVLRLNASLIDLIGDSAVTGFSQLQLNSETDIRLRSARSFFDLSGDLPISSLTLNGDLYIDTEQIYPTTLSVFNIKSVSDDGTIDIRSPRTARDDVLSVGGQLTLEASNIVSRGVIRAPGGELNLIASDSIELLAGSITSVSLNNLTVPFGRTEAGDYAYTLPGGTTDLILTFDGAPTKNLTLNSDSIEFAEGAVIDVSGGGELLAYEQVPGPSGTFDILDSEQFPNHFAIVPGLDLTYAPFDSAESTGSNIAVGDQIIISSSASGLPAGRYTLLPARYAILSGAFLIRRESGFNNIPDGQSFALSDGSTLVAGKRTVANTGIIESMSQGYSLIPNASLDRFVGINTTTGTSFFTERAQINGLALPSLSRDAGSLDFIANSSLSILGDIRAGAARSGLESLINIQADKIALISSTNDPEIEGFLSLVVDTIENTNSGSVLIGGSRQRGTDGQTTLNILSSEVIVTEGTSVNGNELLLAATDSVRIENNASINSNTSRQSNSSPETLIVQGDGALVRVSSNNQVSVQRSGATGTQGEFILSQGASLNASNSITIDSSNDFDLLGSISTDNGSLSLSATNITVGDDTSVAGNGLILTADYLSSLDSDELILKSQNAIDLAADTTLSLGNLVLDTTQLRATNASNTVINTNTLTLNNSNTISDVSTEDFDDDGSLQVNANSVFITNTLQTVNNSEVGFTVDGIQDLQINADNNLVYIGENSFDFDGSELIINTPLITSSGSRSSLQINALNADVTLAGGVADTELMSNSIGSRFALNVNSLLLDTAIVNRAGNFNVTSTNDIQLLDNAIVDLSGTTRDFIYETKAFSAGNLRLISNSGSVNASNAVQVDLSASDIAGNAGTFFVEAVSNFTFAGSLDAEASSGFDSGKVSITAGTISDFNAFNQQLNSAGAYKQRYIRVTGAGENIVVDNDQVVKSESVRLVADQGRVVVNNGGLIDATTSNQGGDIYLAALQEVRIESGASVDASAADGSNTKGGDFTIEITSDTGQINLLAGSQIELSGDGGKENGKLLAKLNSDLVGSNLSDRLNYSFDGVVGDKSLSIVSVTEGTSVTQADIQAAVNDINAYISTNITSLLTEINDLQVSAAPEIRGVNLSTSGEIDLSSFRTTYQTPTSTQASNPITLTLRASEDLTITNKISDGFDGNDKLLDEQSSEINLIAGADLDSAYQFATVRDQGGLLFNDVIVRTGTGDINLISGGDINISEASIYTAGRSVGRGTLPDNVTAGFGGNQTLANAVNALQYGDAGGDVTVQAKGNFIAADNPPPITTYVNRFGNAIGTSTGGDNLYPTLQSVDYSNFLQGFGIFGGGDFRADIEGNAENLTVSIPTLIQHQGDFGPAALGFSYTDNSFAVLGGGDIEANVGDNLIGGNFYVESGYADINVGRNIGTGEIVQQGNDELYDGLILALGDAEIDVNAGGDVYIDAIFNPSLLPQNLNSDFAGGGFFGGGTTLYTGTRFVSYTDRSQVNVTSVNGDIDFRQSLAAVSTYNFNNTAEVDIRLVPGSLEFNALQGDLLLYQDFVLSPASNGGLRFFAGNDITQGQDGTDVIISDADISFFPTAQLPDASLSEINERIDNSDFNFTNSVVPVHINDTFSSALVALAGDIKPIDRNFTFTFAEPVNIFAGNDIINPNFNIQHNRVDSVSTIQALRNIIFPSRRDDIGRLITNTNEIVINGPGRLEIITGGSINLGSSLGISSNGSQSNPFLSGPGADILLLVGTDLTNSYNANISVQNILAIIDEYTTGELGRRLLREGVDGVDDGEKIGVISGTGVFDDTFSINAIAELRENIVSSVINFAKNQLGGNPTQTQAFDYFNSAAQADRRELITSIITEIFRTSTDLVTKSSNVDENGLNREGYDLGFGIMQLFFPQTELVQSNLSLVNSRISTGVDGGDIDIIVPGGDIDVGLASVVPGAREDRADQDFFLGILSRGIGNINVIARDDININSSRIFTVGQQGDVVLASQLGDVDAGRGPRRTAPPADPVTEIVNGLPQTSFPTTISGNGILVSSDAFFWIPNGILDPGSAGIEVLGNASIGGIVPNPTNISISGDTSGSLSDSGPPIGLTSLADNVSAGVADAVEDSALGEADEQASSFAEQALKWLEVFVLGFGDENANSLTN